MKKSLPRATADDTTAAESAGTVAICVPTYNQSQFLRDAIGSCFAQTYRDEQGNAPQVWVGDDASTDETATVLAELQREYPALRVHRQPRNLGIVGNNNWLLSQPQTEFICRLDSDDVLCPNYIAFMVELLRQNARAGYGHAAIEQIDERGAPMRLRLLNRATGYQSADEALRAAASGYRVAANICTFRRAALHEGGFYQAGMKFCEDWNLSVRLADRGWGNVYSDQVLAKYRVWEDASQVRPRRKLSEVEGFLWVFERELQPAWTRRGWDAAPLRKARRAIALSHGSVLDSPLFCARDRGELKRLLKRLGDSSRLRLQTFLLRCGLGGLVRAQRGAAGSARDFAKKMRRTVKK